MHKLYIYILSLILLYACTGGDEHVIALLDQAEAIMEEYPDSAYTLLYNTDTLRIESDDVPPPLRARYYLLLGTAMNKTDRPMTFDYYQTFSRHGRVSKLSLLIWLNENVRINSDVFSPWQSKQAFSAHLA